MAVQQQHPTVRMRRLRHHPVMRDLVRESSLSVNDLIFPLFIKQTEDRAPISSLPGLFQLSLDDLEQEINEVVALKIPAVLLFGIPLHKDSVGSDSYSDNGIIQQAIKRIKKIAPDLLLMTDVSLCEYNDHAHCGVMNEKTGRMDLDNDATLELLNKQVVSHVKAGADVVAPSGMIDGAVGSVRKALDSQGFSHIPIVSYSAKFASSFYGPFREAVESAPEKGDRKSYQMDPANGCEAVRECLLDVNEGADVLMVKPAGPYLDVIYRVKQRFPELPLAAYQVSGEYAMIKAAGANGWIDEKKVVLESLVAMKRAGADFIFSYFAKEVAGWLR